MTAPTRPRPRVRAARRLARSPRRVSPRARRRLLAAGIGLLVLAALYVSVVRDLEAFAIERVDLEGASSGYAPQLATELEAATQGMTTLHVDRRELRELAGRYPAVISLETDATFPDRLTVRVVERPPVGLVAASEGERVPVAADGSLLEGQPVDHPLPTLPGRASSGRRARRSETAAAARLAAAAPRPLAAWLEQVRRGSAGWTVELRLGPELRFGSLARLRAKWSAAAAVLPSPGARGARYIDLRLPDRPAAGGFGDPAADAPAGPSSGAAKPSGEPNVNSQPTVETQEQP